jgi:hypothetical protein
VYTYLNTTCEIILAFIDMYSGFNKGDGGVIGPIERDGAVLDLSEASATSSADEAIICSVMKVDEDGNSIEATIAVTARLVPSSGDIVWVEVCMHHYSTTHHCTHSLVPISG